MTKSLIGFGTIAGLFFGFFCRLFLVWHLGAFNPQVKQSHGRKAIFTAVSRGMLFLLPFTVMAFVSFYYLRWYITSGFLSAGIMSAAASASIEIGRLKQKQEIKNTEITSLVTAAFSAHGSLEPAFWRGFRVLSKVSWSLSGLRPAIYFGLVALVIGLVSGKSVYTLYALGIIVALLLLTWLLIMALYRGKYDVEFRLDDKGVLCRTQGNQKKKNRVVNTLTVVLGLFSGKPTAAGAGMLAQSRQEVFLKWSRITKVKYKPKSCTILLWGGFTEQIALFCTPENYMRVKDFIIENTGTGTIRLD